MIEFSVKLTFSYTLSGTRGSLRITEPGEVTLAIPQSERQISFAGAATGEGWVCGVCSVLRQNIETYD